MKLMVRETLLDFFDDIARIPSAFLVHDDGYRSRTFTYQEVEGAARAFAARLRAAGIDKGEKVVFWGENRPEWIIAFWGCLLARVIVVPIDYRASADLLQRVRRTVQARAVLVGDEVHLPPLEDPIPVWRLADAVGGPEPPPPLPPRSAISRDDIAEIIFTSGATAEPKGVIITHRNILANIVPVEREVAKYRSYARPFLPLRFLNLLPLSHMFGQAMATFIPPMFRGTTVFMRGYNPGEIVRQVKTRRISVVVCVPKILDVLREHVIRLCPETARPPAAKMSVAGRWWRYREIHRLLGWKFWAFCVGAAPLDPGLEEFWSRLGFAVVQGYGLTETAPIVTLNHPLKTRRGTVGTPIPGVEVRIAPDGEILVRGDNVTPGYYRAEAETAGAFVDGWLHTGDIGAFDPEGRLIVRGRKKEVIVTPEGLNVFPEDVERVLDDVPGVRESAAVGVTHDREERVHAVLVLDPNVDASAVVRVANARLEDHQKIRSMSLWPAGELPRTEGTKKLRRREIRQWAETGAPPHPTAPHPEDTVETIVARFASGRAVTPDTTLEELGLTSLERVELMMALEERFETTVDEVTFARAGTVADLHALVERAAAVAPKAAAAEPSSAAAAEVIEFPSWNRRALPYFIRRVSLPTWILPLARLFAWTRVEGLAALRGLEGPVVFAANHQSHLDTPVIMAALPRRWRYRVAPAMAKEFFRAHFHPDEHTWRERLTNHLNYYLAALFFNAFPLPQREAGTRETLRYIGQLLDQGWSILLYPEGRRTQRGEIASFRPGVGMIGARLGVPIVPVRLKGLERVLHQSWRMARPGRVRVSFGTPLRLEGDDYAALARQVEQAVKAL